jgi:hypothetical protein
MAKARNGARTVSALENLEPRRLLSAGLAPRAIASAADAVVRPDYNTGTGLFVKDGAVYDANGYPFVMRGFNHTVAWGDTIKNLDSLNEFDKTGANAVRAVFHTFGGGASPAQRKSVVEKLIGEGIVPIVEDHSITNGKAASELQGVVNRWLQPENVAWLKQHEKNIVLNIANEWGPDSTLWRDAYISSIARLRDAGVNAMIMVDAGISGQSANTLAKWGQDIIDADPQHNVVLSVHMYGYWRSEGATDVGTDPYVSGAPWDIRTELTKLKNAGAASGGRESSAGPAGRTCRTTPVRPCRRTTTSASGGWRGRGTRTACRSTT